ncbi:Heat shock protein 16 [Hypsizygus marmoreus]|uniref:Heat shock protein 16 n=1 Tax=Hypsizygus marmoreus TaxID=39966 RepID=A0A369JMQ9_HYPMA|nr:Heat shock protein 16 [Hypsizygus marmoreus]
MSSVFFYEPFYDFDRLLDDALSTRWIAPPAPGTQLARRGPTEGTDVIRALKPRHVHLQIHRSCHCLTPMDLHENTEKNAVTATFELPGLKKEDVQIDVNNGRLTVSGESKLSSEYEEGGYAVRERRYGKFSRTLQLPEGVKDSDIKATMDSGVLSVTFPKASAEQAPKRITIA